VYIIEDKVFQTINFSSLYYYFCHKVTEIVNATGLFFTKRAKRINHSFCHITVAKAFYYPNFLFISKALFIEASTLQI
jgi:hypothetical protein